MFLLLIHLTIAVNYYTWITIINNTFVVNVISTDDHTFLRDCTNGKERIMDSYGHLYSSNLNLYKDQNDYSNLTMGIFNCFPDDDEYKFVIPN